MGNHRNSETGRNSKDFQASLPKKAVTLRTSEAAVASAAKWESEQFYQCWGLEQGPQAQGTEGGRRVVSVVQMTKPASQGAWVAQRLSVCLPLAQGVILGPGPSPTSGSLHGACFSLCLCLCLSLSLCVSHE